MMTVAAVMGLMPIWNFEMKRGTVDVSELPIPELRGH